MLLLYPKVSHFILVNMVGFFSGKKKDTTSRRLMNVYCIHIMPNKVTNTSQHSPPEKIKIRL